MAAGDLIMSIDLTINITLICYNCGEEMVGTYNKSKGSISVEPCEKCLKEDQDTISGLEGRVQELENRERELEDERNSLIEDVEYLKEQLGEDEA